MAKSLLACSIMVLLFLTWIDISQPLKIKSGKNKGGSKKPTSNWGSWGNPNTGTGNTGGTWGNQNRNPSYPGSNWNNWGQNYNPYGGGSSYNNKQWKPYNKPKPNMKMMAGAAVAGAVAGGIGGYALGNAVGRSRIFFDDDYQRQYYNYHSNQFPDRVYRPQYYDNQRVTEDIFVNDCFNYSMTEFVMKPSAEKNINETDAMEIQVMQHVIRQLCIREYRMASGAEILTFSSLVLCVLLFISFVTH
uniref:Major prion protein homolog n=1 Tax=Geotrypetes seraphini TaxID=260995 RepID=A0A6P8RJD1_GEOSA|nr:major prion protein homolog [Geotrypetes seraphini]XP_033803327.1 major prion protein homolog [Geotrypetes seraphini]XP_033803328.1 major prion protein homolog [Geotrypetes seraphini]XP_033803329.1 major prion protein homolog [Geotrypetes seraphini]XP_033803330.1 major prion protein homolog [Geotrypetes seraphini]